MSANGESEAKRARTDEGPGAAATTEAGADEAAVILVTGGSGLVGKAVEEFVNSAKGRRANERWAFCTSKDATPRRRARCSSA